MTEQPETTAAAGMTVKAGTQEVSRKAPLEGSAAAGTTAAAEEWTTQEVSQKATEKVSRKPTQEEAAQELNY